MQQRGPTNNKGLRVSNDTKLTISLTGREERTPTDSDGESTLQACGVGSNRCSLGRDSFLVLWIGCSCLRPPRAWNPCPGPGKRSRRRGLKSSGTYSTRLFASSRSGGKIVSNNGTRRGPLGALSASTTTKTTTSIGGRRRI